MAKRTFKTSGGRSFVPITRDSADAALELRAARRLARRLASKGGEIELRAELPNGEIRVLGVFDADDLDDVLADLEDLFDFADDAAGDMSYDTGDGVVGITAVTR